MDRDRIERRDFPTGRRGYDPAAVDEHLRRVADEFDAHVHTPTPSMAESTSEQVRLILEAAERGASELRATAGTEASGHVARVQEAADGMLTKLDALESELNRLLTALRTSGERLVEGLAELQAEAASGLGTAESKGVPAEPEQLDTRPPAPIPPAADTPPAPQGADEAPPADASPGAADAAPAPSLPAADDAPAADSPPAPTSPAPADLPPAPTSPAVAASSSVDAAPGPSPVADGAPASPTSPAADDDAPPAPAADASTAPTPAADSSPTAADAAPAADASPAPTPSAHDSPPLSAPGAPDWPAPSEALFEPGSTLFPEEPPDEPEDAGARLIALNMALSGSSRDDTRVFLEEHFSLPDVEALLDDVYARAGH